MKNWVWTIDRQYADRLGVVRTLPNVQVGLSETTIWLMSPDEDIRLRQLPVLHTYRLDEENRLFPEGKKTPVGMLPELDWEPLQRWMPIEFPASALPGEAKAQIKVKLIQAEIEKKADALLAEWSVWNKYAQAASAHRLKPLAFAAAADNRVLIIGTPLPPIPGKAYWVEGPWIIPCGKKLEFEFLSKALAAQLNPEKNAMLLLHEENRLELIFSSNLITTSRSAVRKTEEVYKNQNG
jgi:hypothetical protein